MQKEHKMKEEILRTFQRRQKMRNKRTKLRINKYKTNSTVINLNLGIPKITLNEYNLYTLMKKQRLSNRTKSKTQLYFLPKRNTLEI